MIKKTATKKTPGKKRQATEARIIEAFEKVLRNEGAEKVGVNAVVREAGVGKGLLYEYFGGLEGLAEAWVKQAAFIPKMEDIAGGDLEGFKTLSAAERIARVHVNYADRLRQDKLAGQLMSEELLKRSALSRPLKRIRNHIGETHEAFFTDDEVFLQPDMTALIFVLQAASNYFAIRSQTAPIYNGVDIATQEGWEMVLGMLERVALLAQDD